MWLRRLGFIAVLLSILGLGACGGSGGSSSPSGNWDSLKWDQGKWS